MTDRFVNIWIIIFYGESVAEINLISLSIQEKRAMSKKSTMREIRTVLECRLTHNMSADKTHIATKISKGTVINIVKRFTESGLIWPLPENISDIDLELLLYPQNKNSVPDQDQKPDIDRIMSELTRPGVTLQLLYEEYEKKVPDAMSRSSFYRYVSESKPQEVSYRMIHKGGDKLFVDYSGKGLLYIDKETGEVIDVQLFVACWGASGFVYAEVTTTQSAKNFVFSHIRAMNYFGVAPHAIVPDNLKSAVIKANYYDPVINPLYQAMAQHYGFVVIPARVSQPKDKACVENSVLQSQRRIVAALRNHQFFSLDEINVSIRKQLEELNDRGMKGYGNQSRRHRFEELDRPFARSLPAKPFSITDIKIGVKVHRDYHIQYDKHFYSVPYQLAGTLVDVHLTDSIIEIYANHLCSCIHQHQDANYRFSTNVNHMPPNHAFVRGWSKEFFLSKARQIGEMTEKVLEKIMWRTEHVEQSYRGAMRFLSMEKEYTAERLEKASARACKYNAFSYHSVKSILENNLDKEQSEDKSDPILNGETHENIRGSQYYSNNNNEGE